MATIDSNNCIPSGLRADIMRNSMENKNLLAKKGSIYVGTGETMTVGGEKIYKTKVLELGANGEVLQNINGALSYSKLTNKNFNSDTNYSNLAASFQCFPVLSSQISGSFSSLRIGQENFSSDQPYPNLIHYSTLSINGPWGCSLSLTLNNNQYLGIKLETSVVPVQRYSVFFTGVACSDMYFTGGILIFNHIMSKGTYSVYAVLRDYVEKNGEIVSKSGISWTGWCLPSNIAGADSAIQNLYRTPLKIEVKDTGSDVECNIYVYDPDSGVFRKLTYTGKNFDSLGEQIF